MRIQTRRAEDLLDAVRRDEILGIFVAQNFRRIADVDGARNVSLGIGRPSPHVPSTRIARDRRGDIVAIDDNGGRRHGGLRPQDQKRNEYQAFHDELPPFFSLLMSEQSTAKSITRGGRLSANLVIRATAGMGRRHRRRDVHLSLRSKYRSARLTRPLMLVKGRHRPASRTCPVSPRGHPKNVSNNNLTFSATMI